MDPAPTLVSNSAPAPTMTRRQAAKTVRHLSYVFLKSNRDLLWVPVLQAVVISIIAIVFGVFVILPALAIGIALHPSTGIVKGEAWGITALAYFVSFFISIFFQTALISVTKTRLAGESAQLGDGFHAAIQRTHVLLLWALISSTVGLLLHILSNAHNLIARVISLIIGATWSVMTYFVLPSIVISSMNPWQAMRNSASIIKRTWGESILSIGGVFVYLWVIAFLSLIIAVVFGFLVAMYLGDIALGFYLVLCVVGYVLFSVVATTLSAVLKTILYEYANDGKTFAGVSPEMLSSIIKKHTE